MLNEDYKDMLQCLLEEKVRFLLVGAAVAAYGYPRATKDMDVFVRAASDNASNLLRALRRFGYLISLVIHSASRRSIPGAVPGREAGF